MPLYNDALNREKAEQKEEEAELVSELDPTFSDERILNHDSYTVKNRTDSTVAFDPFILQITGIMDCKKNPPFPRVHAGNCYLITGKGKFGTIDVEAGDLMIPVVDMEESIQERYANGWRRIPKEIASVTPTQPEKEIEHDVLRVVKKTIVVETPGDACTLLTHEEASFVSDILIKVETDKVVSPLSLYSTAAPEESYRFEESTINQPDGTLSYRYCYPYLEIGEEDQIMLSTEGLSEGNISMQVFCKVTK